MAGVSAGCSVTLLVTVSWELLTCGEVPRQRHGAAGGAFGLAVSFIKLQDTLMLVRQGHEHEGVHGQLSLLPDK